MLGILAWEFDQKTMLRPLAVIYTIPDIDR
jgi:hypothetical protein